MPRKLWFINLLPSSGVFNATASSSTYTFSGLVMPNFVSASPRSTIILRSWECNFTPSAVVGDIGTSTHLNNYIAVHIPFITNSIINTLPPALAGIGHCLYLPTEPRIIRSGASECRYFFDVDSIPDRVNIVVHKETITDDLKSLVLIFEVDIA